MPTIPAGTQIGADGQRHPVGAVPEGPTMRERHAAGEFDKPVADASRVSVGGYDSSSVPEKANEAIKFINAADGAEDERARAAIVREVELGRDGDPRKSVKAKYEAVLGS